MEIREYINRLEAIVLLNERTINEEELSKICGEFLVTSSLTSVLEFLKNGNYIAIIESFATPSSLSLPALYDTSCITLLKTPTESAPLHSLSLTQKLRKRVKEFLDNCSDDEKNPFFWSDIFKLVVLAIAHLQLFCQSNYSGPELSNDIANKLHFNDETLQKHSLEELECDGQYAFPITQIPYNLLIARVLLTTLASPMKLPWQSGILIQADGTITRKEDSAHYNFEKVSAILNLFESIQWWNGRSALIHLRLLQTQSHESVPTLWQECQEMFHISSNYSLLQFNGSELNDTTRRRLFSMFYLEWGLSYHHFSYQDKGKALFKKAKECAGLQTKLTAALGRRTKYQREDFAQLYLYAKSSLLLPEGNPSLNESKNTNGIVIHEATRSTVADSTEIQNESETQTEGWQHGEWELGRRLITEGMNGQEVAVREVLLDSMDGGAQQNILIEGGPKFASEGGTDYGGDLHPVDQAIVLAMCLDVSNSNPVDGLTNEEMMPFIERVLLLAKNWMIHSTALLERSWLEYERRKTADRAMLQIQALLDQHSTKLTMLQSTRKAAVEESAPAQERLEYIYCIVYPAQYELKRDLAFRYLRGNVVASALNLFRELELWDEVITCYQLMQKPHRAELLVRERIKFGETPYMLTALADLTGKEDLYEKAWILSRRRYPRAKRTLGKICYDRGDFEICCVHLQAALDVHPLVPRSWYLKGICCMKLERWDDAIQAFVRCVQQDQEIGEAWGNIGAIYMKLRDWSKAYGALTEGYKQKRESWRMLENLMVCTLYLGKWREVILHMNGLLDLRNKSNQPVHLDELRRLCYMISKTAQRDLRNSLKSKGANGIETSAVHEKSSSPEGIQPLQLPSNRIQYVELGRSIAMKALKEGLSRGNNLDEMGYDDTEDEQDEEELYEIIELKDTVLIAHQLLERITQTLKSDANIWDVVAEFQYNLGRLKAVQEARIKQVRTMMLDSNWEKSPETTQKLINTAILLVDSYKYEGSKKVDLYGVKSILLTIQRRLESFHSSQILMKSSHPSMDVRQSNETASSETYTVFINVIQSMIARIESIYPTMIS